MAMNYYAIQMFHARLKVSILKYDVNLGRQQKIIIQKSSLLLFEYVTRGSTSKATITRCDLSATILFNVVDSYLIAFKFAQ